MVQGKRDLKKKQLFKPGGQRKQWNEIHDINVETVIDVQKTPAIYGLIQSSQIEKKMSIKI